MKRNYVVPALRQIELDSDEGLLTGSNYIDITDKPVTDPATQKKNIWGREDMWD